MRRTEAPTWGGEGETMKHLGRRFAVTVVVVSTLLVTGVAFAAWLATGFGAAYSKAGKVVPLSTKDVSATVTESLFPGGDGNLAIQIHNPNPFPVDVWYMEQVGPAVVESAGIGTCEVFDIRLNDPNGDGKYPVGQVIAGRDDLDADFQDAVHMGEGTEDGCQGATFEIPITMTGRVGA